MNLINENDSWVAILAYICFVLSGFCSHAFRRRKARVLKKIANVYVYILVVYLMILCVYGVYFTIRALTAASLLLAIVFYFWPAFLIVRSDWDLFKRVFSEEK